MIRCNAPVEHCLAPARQGQYNFFREAEKRTNLLESTKKRSHPLCGFQKGIESLKFNADEHCS